MKTHAQIRLKQRYHQAYTTSLRNALIKRINDGRARISRYFDNSDIDETHKYRCIVTVLYNRIIYKFIYDEKKGVIVTFLPL